MRNSYREVLFGFCDFSRGLEDKRNIFGKKSQSCYYDTFHIGVVIMSDE